MGNKRKTFKRVFFGSALGLGLLSLVSGLQVNAGDAHKPDPAALLYIGDSHTVGGFGRILDRKLRELPAASVAAVTVASYGSCGSSPVHWYNGWRTRCGWVERSVDGKSRGATVGATPHVELLIQKHQPKLLVIALGANLMSAGMDSIRNSTRRMMDTVRASGAQCVWVGPPNGRNKAEPKFSELVAELQKITEGTCSFVDSRPLTQYPASGGDGAHFDGLPAAVRDPILATWTSGVMNEVSAVWKTIGTSHGN